MKKRVLFILLFVLPSFFVSLLPPSRAVRPAPFEGMWAEWLITRYQEYPNGTLIPPNQGTGDPLTITMDRYRMRVEVSAIESDSIGYYARGTIFVTREPRQIPDPSWQGSTQSAFYNYLVDGWFYWFPSPLEMGDKLVYLGFYDHNISRRIKSGLWFYYLIKHYHNDDPVTYPTDGEPLTVVGEAYHYAFFTFLECWEMRGSRTYDRIWDQPSNRNTTVMVDKQTGLIISAHYKRGDEFAGEWYGEPRTEHITMMIQGTNAYEWYEKWLGFISMVVIAFSVGLVYVERVRSRGDNDPLPPERSLTKVSRSSRPYRRIHIQLLDESFSPLRKEKSKRKCALN